MDGVQKIIAIAAVEHVPFRVATQNVVLTRAGEVLDIAVSVAGRIARVVRRCGEICGEAHSGREVAHGVGALAAVEEIGRCCAPECIAERAANQIVKPGIEGVVRRFAVVIRRCSKVGEHACRCVLVAERVIAPVADHRVSTGTALDDVVAGSSGEVICARPSPDVLEIGKRVRPAAARVLGRCEGEIHRHNGAGRPVADGVDPAVAVEDVVRSVAGDEVVAGPADGIFDDHSVGDRVAAKDIGRMAQHAAAGWRVVECRCGEIQNSVPGAVVFQRVVAAGVPDGDPRGTNLIDIRQKIKIVASVIGGVRPVEILDCGDIQRHRPPGVSEVHSTRAVHLGGAPQTECDLAVRIEPRLLIITHHRVERVAEIIVSVAGERLALHHPREDRRAAVELEGMLQSKSVAKLVDNHLDRIGARQELLSAPVRGSKSSVVIGAFLCATIAGGRLRGAVKRKRR